MPVIYKIIVFFIILFGFFGVSWLWHWVWFSGGDQVTAHRLVSGSTVRNDDRQTAAMLRIQNAVKLFTAGLVTAFLIGLYMIIFSLLN